MSEQREFLELSIFDTFPFSSRFWYFVGIVKHFIENDGMSEVPKLNKYKKYGAINSNSVRICMASLKAIAHSPFYTGEYYSKLSPLWQRIAHKVRPTYKVVLRSAVDDLLGPSGIFWRPIILPNCYKSLVNSESDVFDDISLMPWHSFPNVQIFRRPLPITGDMPSVAPTFCDAETQTDELPAVVATTTREAQTDADEPNHVNIREHKSRKLEITNRELMKVFNRLMERELIRFETNGEVNEEIHTRMNNETLTANRWFPVVSIKRSRSIENMLAGEEAVERKLRRTTN